MGNVTTLVTCPECGGMLKAGGACTACGYGHKRVTRQPTGDPSYNRCSWQFASERCAYLARVYPGPPMKGNGFCWPHFGCQGDPKKGAEIVSRSRQEVPIDFDYSSAALVTATREAFEKRPIRP